MYKLRWLIKSAKVNEVPKRVLQYRTGILTTIYSSDTNARQEVLWEEWQDVPEVKDES